MTTRRGNLHTQSTGTAAKITPSLSNRESAWLPHKGKAPFAFSRCILISSICLAGIAAAAEPELGPNGQFGQRSVYYRSGASTSCRVCTSGALTAWYAGAIKPARRGTEHDSGLICGDLPVLCEMQNDQTMQIVQLHGCNGGTVRAMCM